MQLSNKISTREPTQEKEWFLPNWVLILVVILFLSFLASIAYLGTFTRLHADDYCMIGEANQVGFWKAMAYWYLSWSGRYAFIFFTQLIGLNGLTLAQILPSVYIILWLVGLTWFYYLLLRIIGLATETQSQSRSRRQLLFAVSLAVANLSMLLSVIPNVYQSFFWENGSINYCLPLIFLTYEAALILYFDNKNRIKLPKRAWIVWLESLCICLLALISGGFSEIYISAQVAIYALALLIVLLMIYGKCRRNLGILFTAGLLGAVISLIIVALAPGNIIRQQAISQVEFPNMMDIITKSAYYAATTGGSLLKHHWYYVLLITLVSGWLGYISDFSVVQRIRKWTLQELWRSGWLPILLGISISCFLVVLAAMAPTVYMRDSYPDPRALIIPLFIITVTVVILGFFTGMKFLSSNLLSRKTILILTSIILITWLGVSSIRSIQQTLSIVPKNQEYARQWDDRDQLLIQAKANGQSEVDSPGLDSDYYGLGDIQVDPGYWINACMAKYYGFSSLRGKKSSREGICEERILRGK